MEPYLRYRPPLRGFGVLSDEVSTRYHQADDGWRMRLARQYGIAYFVMDKNKMREPVVVTAASFQRAYENKDFVVLKSNEY